MTNCWKRMDVMQYEVQSKYYKEQEELRKEDVYE